MANQRSEDDEMTGAMASDEMAYDDDKEGRLDEDDEGTAEKETKYDEEMSTQTEDAETTAAAAEGGKEAEKGLAKPQSAYFHFLAAKRPQAKAENPGATIGTIQKVLGTMWKELTPEDKEPYVQLALKDKERYAAAKQDMIDRGMDVAPEKPAAPPAEDVLILPLSRVKRIISADPDVGKVSKDAQIAIAKATELFIQFLAAKGYDSALISKRKTIKDSDLLQAIHALGCLDWLRDDFPQSSSATTSRSNEPKAKPVDAPTSEASRITSFFTRSES
ncbi:hypothetical protein SPRG_04796 [Saprolegnia parasitica CBS 223.65]|uniref:HMG box domain-containing protein n=1 Tax=Saprolegnia parasitica (strain CBS 223.65) TaxID=695850 RepID=A0A067CK56_SAPPC|nr:hypothetical protein SPRG_04796 [Saprolegnia parasitica CBS 223.65]KDO30893.1 hypothetical protein SPRG_04796 [Saprolegnia parasitica CBS 223.65]|eukprot:XP_012198587.1 hypothetical protein SPRG_04796 [Saprolegnia parasitica CBS 223.65]